MILMLYFALLLITQSMPAMTSLVLPTPSSPSTRTLTTWAPGAMPPVYCVVTPAAYVPVPVMIPATCVPCPYSSVVGSPAIMLTLARTFPVNALCEAMPESSTATTTPCPVTPGMPPRPRSNPALPARTWSAAVVFVETSMKSATAKSPERCWTAGSSRSASICVAVASKTAASSRNLWMCTPRRTASSRSCGSDPCAITRTAFAECDASNARRSSDSDARM